MMALNLDDVIGETLNIFDRESERRNGDQTKAVKYFVLMLIGDARINEALRRSKVAARLNEAAKGNDRAQFLAHMERFKKNLTA